jgi:hypothetical protein
LPAFAGPRRRRCGGVLPRPAISSVACDGLKSHVERVRGPASEGREPRSRVTRSLTRRCNRRPTVELTAATHDDMRIGDAYGAIPETSARPSCCAIRTRDRQLGARPNSQDQGRVCAGSSDPAHHQRGEVVAALDARLLRGDRERSSGAASRSDHGVDAGAGHRPGTLVGDDRLPLARIEGGERGLD